MPLCRVHKFCRFGIVFRYFTVPFHPFHLLIDIFLRNLSNSKNGIFYSAHGAAWAIFRTVHDDTAPAAGEVAAAVKLRKAGFGEGTPQQASEGTEGADSELCHVDRMLL